MNKLRRSVEDWPCLTPALRESCLQVADKLTPISRHCCRDVLVCDQLGEPQALRWILDLPGGLWCVVDVDVGNRVDARCMRRLCSDPSSENLLFHCNVAPKDADAIVDLVNALEKHGQMALGFIG